METKPPPYSPEYQHDFPVTNAPPPYSAGYVNAPPPNVTYPASPMYPAYQATAPPGYGTTITVTPAPVAAPIIVVGGCPSCRIGLLEDDFTCCGVFMAIFFFPLGILCCLAMRQKRCPRCGAVFG